MNYDDSVRYLLSLGRELAAPRQPAPAGGPQARKFDLRNIQALAARMGDAHCAVPCAHIAGTNGKGSTAAMLESILRHSGLRTGLFTSPHLEKINERIRIQGEDIGDEEFAAGFTRLHAVVEELLAAAPEAGPERPGLAAHPTYFECLTAMAFGLFARHRLDFAVYEAGMGGRLDATNIVTPEVAVITQIDFDHESYLGHSIELIAGEKAGIIKPGVPVVCAAGHPQARAVIARHAAELGARLVDVDEAGGGEFAPGICVPLPGRFQLRNAATARAAARVLVERGFAITEEAIARGLGNTRWPGRLELLQTAPDFYLDGTHNPAGARELLHFWETECAGRRIHLVYGAMRDKAVDEIAGLLFPRAATVILTQPDQPRAISAAALAELTAHLAPRHEVVTAPAAAVERALEIAAADEVVFATGSLYLAGDVRRWWRERSAARPRPAAATRRATR